MRFIDKFDALLFDLDGTLWAGSQPIPGAVEALAATDVDRMFVTNNAARAPHVVADKLTAMGMPASEEQVLTSSQAAIHLASQHLEPGSKVFVAGTDSFKDLAKDAGFIVVDSADDNPAAVLQGHNPETGWAVLTEAALAIRSGARFFASNLDTSLPMERGFAIGNGAMVEAVAVSTGVRPKAAGKPEPTMFHMAVEKLGSKSPLAVGDRLDTDSWGGNRAGMPSLYVSTGVSSPWDVLNAPKDQRPTFLASNLLQIFDDYESLQPGAQGGFNASRSGERIVLGGGNSESTSIEALRTVAEVIWTADVVTPCEVVAEGEFAQQAVAQW
ncbi:Haloacid dehalogenase (HAD) superfamily hydrolase [Corynebacterium renale]|uniref:HAD-IIA family hydrolase n=1 Tax=Corynebacterium renale TaxID=1724 RepID=UPI000DA3B6AD|nr:HAD-IIA family hydrolase [Corynebacterium renale]SQG64628.1 Haloacid dehalogenase (HAD) superfamily hydrolase [Corynebacterium renale]